MHISLLIAVPQFFGQFLLFLSSKSFKWQIRNFPGGETSGTTIIPPISGGGLRAVSKRFRWMLVLPVQTGMGRGEVVDVPIATTRVLIPTIAGSNKILQHK
jgi:hypothetical protein